MFRKVVFVRHNIAMDERRDTTRHLVSATVFTRELDEDEYQMLLRAAGDDPKLPQVADIKTVALGKRAWSFDVSEGGVGLEGDLELSGPKGFKMGERLALTLDFDGMNQRVKAVGRVVWTVPGKGDTAKAGVAFAMISDRDLEKLRSILATQAAKNPS